MTFVPMLALVFVVNKVVDWLRELVPDRLEPRVLIPLSWFTGAVVTWLFSLTQFAEEVGVGDRSLDELDVIAVVFVGVLIGAGGSVLNDLKPNRLSTAQLDRAVEQADTIMVEGPATPLPIATTEPEAPAKPKARPRKRTT